MAPTAPFPAMTNDMMKKEMATMMTASLQPRPTAIMLLANCQVAALKASEIQYAGGMLVLVLSGRVLRHANEANGPPLSEVAGDRV